MLSLPTLTRRTHPQQLHTWLTGSSLANSQMSACSQSYVHVRSRQVQGQRVKRMDDCVALRGMLSRVYFPLVP
jgi:hypothetical protein